MFFAKNILIFVIAVDIGQTDKEHLVAYKIAFDLVTIRLCTIYMNSEKLHLSIVSVLQLTFTYAYLPYDQTVCSSFKFLLKLASYK
jgi:hypothetical protein